MNERVDALIEFVQRRAWRHEEGSRFPGTAATGPASSPSPAAHRSTAASSAEQLEARSSTVPVASTPVTGSVRDARLGRLPASGIVALRRSRAVAVLLTVMTGLLVVGPVNSADATPTKGTSTTGGIQAQLRVPVNVVLIGFDAHEVSAGLLAGLAPSSDPVVEAPAQYGINQPVGVHYDYDYRLRQAPQALTEQFFRNQLRTGQNQPLTTYQQAYNAQAHNRLDVTGPILSDDAPATQQWLDQNVGRSLGIDLQHSYTVYLVNWWGRPDFRFHNYRVASAVDHDTGIDWANDKTPFPYIPTTHWDQTALNGWGGATARSWFYDVSAGPDFYDNNWNVDDADLDGDGYPDYRIPPIWEYAADGYRARSDLPTDLGKLVRFVAVDGMFTTSPFYDPMTHQPPARGAAQLHTTIFEDNPAINGDRLTDTPYAMATLRTLDPWLSWKSSNKDVNPEPADIHTAVGAFLFGTPQPPGCWQTYGFSGALLYCTLLAQEAAYVPVSGRDEVIPSFTFTGTQAELSASPIEGFADDDYTDGKPTWTVQFLWPDSLAYGDGNTWTTTHEIGHELGATHPHDGYDSTTGVFYSRTGNTFFTWAGDQSATLMGYTRLDDQQFSVFDKDNIARDTYVGYLASMEPPDQRTVTQRLLVAAAKFAFDDWQFPQATALVRQAWALGAGHLSATTGLGPQARAATGTGHPDARQSEPKHPDLNPR